MQADVVPLSHPFAEPEQQRRAATLGMWVFLATEVLFFGGLFLSYTVYRIKDPATFRLASAHTLLLYGTINTAVLIVSSLTMALAVRAAALSRGKAASAFLGVTAALGTAFLAIKSLEYYHEILEGLLPTRHFHWEEAGYPHAKMFFYLYFMMTGLHALHVLIGVFFNAGLALRLRAARCGAAGLSTTTELAGLYWHFVDVVWVFLFPLIYLLNPHL